MVDAAAMANGLSVEYNARMQEEVINETLCSLTSVPDISSYYRVLGPVWGPVLVSCASVLVLCVLLTSFDTLRHIVRHDRPQQRADTITVIGVYPIIALSCLATLLVPRAFLLSEAITQVAFMTAAQRFYCLLLSYCCGATAQHTSCSGSLASTNAGLGNAGADQELVRAVKQKDLRLSMRTPPCCCWPCLRPLLPDRILTEQHIRNLGYLVLQLPMVQTFIYVLLLIMWAENQRVYDKYFIYLQPFVVASILIGIWGITMTVKLVSDFLDAMRALQRRFLCLQLVLVCSKLQGLAVRSAAANGLLPCLGAPLTNAAFGNLIQNSALLCEMLLLAVWARSIYRRPLILQDELISNPAAEPRLERENNNVGLVNTPRWSEMKDSAYVIENQYGVENIGGAHRGRRSAESKQEMHM